MIENETKPLFCGDSKRLRFTLVDGDNGNAILNLTGLTVTWKLAQRDGVQSTFKAPVLTKVSTDAAQIEVTALSGIAEVILLSADTVNLSPGKYTYTVTTTTVGGQVSTVATGVLLLEDAL